MSVWNYLFSKNGVGELEPLGFKKGWSLIEGTLNKEKLHESNAKQIIPAIIKELTAKTNCKTKAKILMEWKPELDEKDNINELEGSIKCML